MKQILFLGFLTIVFITACSINKINADAESPKTANEKNETNVRKNNKSLVLVELFTSEGCSSCPPADRVLEKLQKEQPIETAEIVTLAFHVDYWNYLGWKDEFSSPKYSQRQSEYARTFDLNSNYTPQMIVDGKQEFVGSKWTTALNEIRQAARDDKGDVEVSVKNDAEKPSLKVKISDINSNEDLEVLLAVAEDNLETNVKRGENSGKKLSHISVVRNFFKIGDVAIGKKDFTKEMVVEIDSSWKKENLNLVVLVQNQKSKNLVALGKTKFEPSIEKNRDKK